jgi:hypothetical protein
MLFRHNSSALHAASANTLQRCCAGTEVGGRRGLAHRPSQAVLHAARPRHALRGSQHARPHTHVRSAAQEVSPYRQFLSSFLVVKIWIRIGESQNFKLLIYLLEYQRSKTEAVLFCSRFVAVWHNKVPYAGTAARESVETAPDPKRI